jgi:hypothetical protein
MHKRANLRELEEPRSQGKLIYSASGIYNTLFGSAPRTAPKCGDDFKQVEAAGFNLGTN